MLIKNDDFLLILPPNDKPLKIISDCLVCPVIESITNGEIRSLCKFAKMKYQTIYCNQEPKTTRD